MQRQVLRRAPVCNFGTRRAINMDLPIHRREGEKIIRAIDPHPWQAIATMHMSCRTTAQGTLAIIQHDLRDGPEQVLSDRIQPGCYRDQHRRNPCAHDIGDPALGGGEAEEAIGGRDQPPCEPDPLSLIGIEQLVGRAAGHHGGKLPGEVDGIANPGIHALSAGRAVNMRGVAKQQRPPLAEMFGNPVMHMIGRKPVDLFHLHLEVADGATADVRECQLAGIGRALVVND